jgi:hypothetical protein
LHRFSQTVDIALLDAGQFAREGIESLPKASMER